MKAVFVELPAFERHRADYLDDDGFRELQRLLMLHPEAGDTIRGTGGLRKLRFADARRGKGETRRPASNLLLVGYRIAILAVYGLRQG
jgi:hypothetical protein